MGYIFEEGERVDEGDVTIDDVEGSFIVNKKVKVCCKKVAITHFVSSESLKKFKYCCMELWHLVIK